MVRINGFGEFGRIREGKGKLKYIFSLLAKSNRTNSVLVKSIFLITEMGSKLLSLRRLSKLLKPHFQSPPTSYSSTFPHSSYLLVLASKVLSQHSNILSPCFSSCSRSFCSRHLDLNVDSQGPATIDYRFVLQHSFPIFIEIYVIGLLMSINVDTVLFCRKMNFID